MSKRNLHFVLMLVALIYAPLKKLIWAANIDKINLAQIMQNSERLVIDSIIDKAKASKYRIAIDGIEYDTYKVFEIESQKGVFFSTNYNYPPPYFASDVTKNPSPIAILLKNDAIKYIAFHKGRLKADKQGSFAQKVFAAIDSVDSIKCASLTEEDRLIFVQKHLDDGRIDFIDLNKKECFENSIDTLIRIYTSTNYKPGKEASNSRQYLLAQMYRIKARGIGFWDRALIDSSIKYYLMTDSAESETSIELFNRAATLLLGKNGNTVAAEMVFSQLMLDTSRQSLAFYEVGKLLVALRRRDWCGILSVPVTGCDTMCSYIPETIQRIAVFEVIQSPREGNYEDNLELAQKRCKQSDSTKQQNLPLANRSGANNPVPPLSRLQLDINSGAKR